MKAHLYASTNERLRSEPAWRLLSANHAPEILAMLQHLLYDKDRSLPGSVLQERMTNELGALREQGRELQGTAAWYMRDWVTEGWLDRRPLPDSPGEEEYELGLGALQALRLLNGLQSTRVVATESRLALVIDQLAQLSRQTDANPQTRLELLHEERRRIDAQIDAVAAGDVDVLAPERAIERLKEIIGLAKELSEDFRRVRDDFGKLNRDFQERIIQDDGQRGPVLADLFAGVDVIADSAPGRTFSAFWRLLTDIEGSAQLEASLDALASREFTAMLARDERAFLSTMTRTLLDRAGAVNNIQSGFSRSLRGFVQSREYEEQRRMSQQLQAAKVVALELRDQMRPEHQTGFSMRLSIATYRSLGQWRLDDPGQGFDTGTLEAAPEAEIGLDEIASRIADSDIDFRVLYENLRETLAVNSQCSIAGLLARYPAPQGLGTVVGYLSLGVKHGEVCERRETVSWLAQDGNERRAGIPLIYFLAERSHEYAR